ncbi:MAG: hypothetical protein LUG50_07410 [Planctomycetaceae bacterium]|nr:hypothetical protein [Planctomycetaceae bacterium]
MTTRNDIDITTLFEQGDAVRDAIRRGGLQAMKQYITAGESMVSWKDGKVIRIPPEELKKMLAEAEGV